MWKIILCCLKILSLASSSGNFYPFQHQFFAHQSVFQGEAGFGFGFHPGIFPQNAQPQMNNNNGNNNNMNIPLSPNGIHGGNSVPIGGNIPVPPGVGIHGGNYFPSVGWTNFPYPVNHFQKPGWSGNDLKPSITGWDTSYTVPCGTYNIFPFVTAKIRYTAGSKHYYNHQPEIPNSPWQIQKSRSYSPYFPPPGPASTCSWNFHASGCKLKFHCTYLQLPALFHCDENVMEYNDTQKYFKYCGSSNRKLHAPLISDSGSLKLTFRSRPHALPSVINCSVLCTPETLFNEDSTDEKQTELKPLKIGKCKCGIRRTVSTGRIVGGKRTSPGEFPWTAALVKKNSNRPFCGGSLINNRYIITAAHCVNNRRLTRNDPEIEVLLNEHDISKVNTLPGGTVRAAIQEIIIHPKYDRITYDFDIALVKLEKSIDFETSLPSNPTDPDCKNQTQTEAGVSKMQNEFDAQFVPVCLPLKSREFTDLEGKEAIVTGWGLTQENGIPASSMMQATVNIFNDSVCHDFYDKTDVITEQMMCVGHPEGKSDSCVGDSGGPLVIKNDESYTLAGIVSWGRGCGRPNLPGVYTRMLGLTDWIHSKAQDSVWCE